MNLKTLRNKLKKDFKIFYKKSTNSTMKDANIFYNKNIVKDGINSWDDFFAIPDKYGAKITMLDDPRETIGVGLIANGNSVNSTDSDEIKAAAKYINDRKFKDHDQLGSLFVASKEIQGDVLIIFADIIFDESILKQILENNSEISIAIDMNWEKYDERSDNSINDADKVSILEGNVKKIFKNMKFHTDEYKIGEFIWISCFRALMGSFYRQKKDFISNQIYF